MMRIDVLLAAVLGPLLAVAVIAHGGDGKPPPKDSAQRVAAAAVETTPTGRDADGRWRGLGDFIE